MVFTRRDDLVAPEIPLDLVIDILRRLPAKSLMRFRCVSKPWSSLIRSRYFSNLYFTKKVSSGQLLLLYGNHNNIVRHSNNDSVDPIKSQLLSLTLLMSSDYVEPSTLKPGLVLPTMEDMGIVGGMVILRGLILYTFCRKACIYNPATRQSLTLPANICAQQELCHKTVNYFFGHDHVLDQYKIVCNVIEMWKTSKFWVFVLEPGGFWKRIEDDDKPHTPCGRGLCINGVIYYLASDHKLIYVVVYCFDVRSEKLRVIQAPREVSAIGRRMGFIEHGGKPTLFDFTLIGETGVSELWVLEDGLVGTWSRKSLVLKPCQRHLLDGIIIGWTRLHGTGQNNQVILESSRRCCLFCYDLIKNDLRKVNIIRQKPNEYAMVVKVMDKCESIMHLEI